MRNRVVFFFVLRGIISLLLSLFIWIGFANISSAEMKKGMEMGLYGGTLSASGGSVQSVDQYREVRSEIKNEGTSAGLRIGYNFNQYFGFETTFGGATNDYVVRLMDSSVGYEPEEVSVEENTELFFFHGNVLLHLPLLEGNVVPFLTGGAGWVLYVDDTSVAYNYGGGVKLFFTDRLFLRLDAREFKTKHKGTITQIHTATDIYWNLYVAEEEVPFTDNLRFREMSLGISYLF